MAEELKNEATADATPAVETGAEEAQYDAAATSGGEEATDAREATGPEEAGFDIDELIDDMEAEIGEVPAEAPAPEPETQAKEAVQEEAPTETPAEPEAKKDEAEAEKKAEADTSEEAKKAEEQVDSKQQEPEPPVTAEADVPQLSQEELNAQYEKFFNGSVELLKDQVYNLSEEDAELLDTEPSKVLPGMAANLHMQVMTAVTTQVANMLPSMMAMHNERQSVAKARESDFFGSYPELKSHVQEVTEISRAYRQMNPTAPYEQAAPMIAAMAKVHLGLPETTSQSQAESVVATPPPVPTSVRGSQAAPAAQPASQTNVWEDLIADD